MIKGIIRQYIGAECTRSELARKEFLVSKGIIRQYIGTCCTRSEDNFVKVFNTTLDTQVFIKPFYNCCLFYLLSNNLSTLTPKNPSERVPSECIQRRYIGELYFLSKKPPQIRIVNGHPVNNSFIDATLP